MNTKYIKQSSSFPTAQYFAIHDEKRDLSRAIADFAIVEHELTPAMRDCPDLSDLLDSCEILVLGMAHNKNEPAFFLRRKRPRGYRSIEARRSAARLKGVGT